MPQPNLEMTTDELASQVGVFLGWGPGAQFGGPAWNTQKEAQLQGIVRSGYRQVLVPPSLSPGEPTYDWSFLKPIGTISVPAGAEDVPMPDDFGGIEGQISVTQDGQSSFWPIQTTNDGRLTAMRAETPTRTGRPIWAAVTPIKGTAAGRGQRWKLLLYPTTDEAYTLQFPYYVSPSLLDGRHQYLLGGPQMAELYLESCLAIAEQRLDDQVGVHTQKFMQMLAAAIGADRKRKPQAIGYNGDRSDAMSAGINRSSLYYDRLGGVTYNGTQY